MMENKFLDLLSLNVNEKVENEIFKFIDNYDNKYMVSNKGRVFSIKSKNFLSQRLNNTGRLRVTLTKKCKSKNVFVHRLVGEYFLNKKELKVQINHIDGNPLNNCVENLEWVTQSENITHAYKNGLMKYKLTLDEEKEIKKMFNNGISKNKISSFGH